MQFSEFSSRRFQLPSGSRALAYSQVGDVDSPEVLLCLPGLLETRASFDPVLQAARDIEGLRVVAVDYCGRGDSDALPNDQGYCMSVYLKDLKAFLRHEIMRSGDASPRIHLLGTSMGGILAMYLVSEHASRIAGLGLNDIGLSLYWMSIYGLYDRLEKEGRLDESTTSAPQLNVSPGVLMAVQLPTHFDVPFQKDWKGMKFASLLQRYKGDVRLVYGGNSPVCLSDQVKEIKHVFPGSQLLKVAGARHPAPFTEAVCVFLLHGLGQGAVVSDIQENSQPAAEASPETVAGPLAALPAAPADPPQGGWLGWLKRKWHRKPPSPPTDSHS